MDSNTVQTLNTINREFYATTANAFDRTRGTAWPGWNPFIPHITREPDGNTFSVLDVGCGNGRFAAFLAENLSLEIDYHGIDSNQTLLDHAWEALRGIPGIALTVEHRDIIEDPPDKGEFEFVALFGVMHHIPGAANRKNLLRKLANRVQAGGWMAFACWRFYEFDRFRERIIPWPENLQDHVETHDYLLDWRHDTVAQRYCHYVDDAEHAALVAASGLEEVVTYRADGFNGALNQYTLLHRPRFIK